MTIPDARPLLTLYRRPDCHLCDEGRAALQAVLEERGLRGDPLPTYREVDVSGDAELEARYGSVVPALELDGQRLDLAINGTRVRAFLHRTLGRMA